MFMLKPIAPDVWQLPTAEPVRFPGGLRLPLASTVVRLRDRTLLLYSPIAIDDAEVDVFRGRAAGASIAALDWPPRAEIGRPLTTRVWLASDRQAYREGRQVPTVRIAPPR